MKIEIWKKSISIVIDIQHNFNHQFSNINSFKSVGKMSYKMVSQIILYFWRKIVFVLLWAPLDILTQLVLIESSSYVPYMSIHH